MLHFGKALTAFGASTDRRRRKGRAARSVCGLATGSFLTFVGMVQAQVWDGSVDTDWSDGNNWVGDVAPTTGGTVSITDNTSNPTELSTTATVATTTISGTGVLTITAGGSLTSTVTLTGGSVFVNGTIMGVTTMTGGTLTLTAGDVGAVTMSDGLFDVDGGAAGAVAITGGTL
ncbi:MAG: hypothetical protein WA782_06855, partial [Sulfitobacter sp.]